VKGIGNKDFYRYVIIAVLTISFYIALFSLLPDSRVVCSLSDDAYYYLQISRNIALGNGSTFDGINSTNGYHPLYLLILIPIHLLVNFNRLLAVRAIFILQGALYFFTLYMVVKKLKSEVGVFGLLTMVILTLYPRFFHILTVGMESLLSLLLLSMIWFYSDGFFKGEGDLKGGFVLGILCGLLTLSRLEVGTVVTALLVLVILIVRFRKWGMRAISNALIIPLLYVIMVMPFLIWNYMVFNHILTISASLKSSYPNIVFNWRYILTYPEYYLGVLVFAIYLLYSGWRRRGGEVLRSLISDALIGATCIVLLLSFLLFARWAHFSHYYAPCLLPIFILVAVAGDYTAGAFKRIFRPVAGRTIFISLLAIFAISSQYIVHRDALKTFKIASYEGAMWAKENTDKKAIFAMKDSGTFGYLSGRRTVNLDGVVNNFEYQEHLKQGRLDDYLSNIGVDYIVQHALWGCKRYVDVYGNETYELYLPSRLYAGYGDSLIFREEDIVYKSSDYMDRSGNITNLAIWRYR